MNYLFFTQVWTSRSSLVIVNCSRGVWVDHCAVRRDANLSTEGGFSVSGLWLARREGGPLWNLVSELQVGVQSLTNWVQYHLDKESTPRHMDTTAYWRILPTLHYTAGLRDIFQVVQTLNTATTADYYRILPTLDLHVWDIFSGSSDTNHKPAYWRMLPTLDHHVWDIFFR